MSRLPYGLAFNGMKIVPEPREAKVIRLIYDTYLTGTPLAGIVDLLHQENIPSPSGKERWSTAVLHTTLSDSRYMTVIGFEKYAAAQFELDKRANYDLVTGKRKTARYHSQNVLSGLFVCAECGRNYRRVQRASGEIVWRCANRVEHGSRFCKSSPTVTEKEAIRFICEITGTSEIEPQVVRDSLESVVVNQDGSLTPERLFVSPDLTIQ